MDELKSMPLFKDRLKWARTRKGEIDGAKISQAELARRVSRRISEKVPQSTIGAYESGGRGTKNAPKNIFAIAAELDISAEWLLNNKGSPFDKNKSLQLKHHTKNESWPFDVSYETFNSMDKSVKEAIKTMMDIATKPYPISDSDYVKIKEAIQSALSEMRKQKPPEIKKSGKSG